MSKSKKILFISIFLLLILFVMEIFSFLIFKLFNYDEKFNLYDEKRVGNLKYVYHNNVQLALPKPDTQILHFTREFIDRFKTKDVLSLGFGLFDDGINLEKNLQSLSEILLPEVLVQGITSKMVG